MIAWILIFFIAIYSVPYRSANYVLRSNVTANRCNINSTVAFWCTIDSLLTNTKDVLWYRKVGDTRQVLGESAIISIDFDGGRYKISMTKRTQTTATYELVITSVQLQDSATIQCVSPTSRQVLLSNSLPIAVCSNTNSTFCSCIATQGWASPKCNEAVETSKNRRYESYKGVVGIAVCLAFMLVVGLVLTVLLITNEVRSCRERERDKEARRIEIEQNHQSRPSGPSILKKKNPEQNQSASPCPRIDTFSIHQLQQIPFQNNPSSPPQQKIQNDINNPSRAISNSTTSNIEIIHKKGDVRYFDNFSRPSNDNSESQI